MSLSKAQITALKFAADAKRTGGQINGKTESEWRWAAYPKTPALDKLKSIAGKSQVVGEFVDIFLAEKGLSLGKPHKHDSRCGGWTDKGGRIRNTPNGSRRPPRACLPGRIEEGEVKPLISILLETHLEREELVRRQNQFAERAALDRWAVKNSSKKNLTTLRRGAKKSA